MRSQEHMQHIVERVSHNRCSECRADNERRFAVETPFRYQFVHNYLGYVKPRILAIRSGEASANANAWHRDFLKAMHRRISSHVAPVTRKRSHSYLERFSGIRGDVGYLRQFAERGASCLDS